MASLPDKSIAVGADSTRPVHSAARAATNLVRVTLICMLAYAIVAGLISLTGTLTAPLALHFQQSLPEAAARFGYLNTGIAFGSVIGLVFFERFNLRRAFIFCQGTVVVSICLIMVLDLWSALPLLLFLAGSAAGLGLCAAAVCLAAIYNGRQRAAALLTTDICFATTGIVLSPLAAWLISGGARWDNAYLLLVIAAACIVLTARYSHFPLTAREADIPTAGRGWPPAAVLCGAGLFFYLFGQVSMLIWVPSYIQAENGGSLALGAVGISRYWTGMVVGQLICVFLLSRFTPVHLLRAAVTSSVICALPLWLDGNAQRLPSILLILGICNAGMLKLTLSFAAEMVAHPQRVVTSLMFCGSLGQAAAPFVSAAFVDSKDLLAGLQLTPFCYLLAALCIGTAIVIRTFTRRNSP